jgi:hypothetical protein
VQGNSRQIADETFGFPLESFLSLKVVDYVHPWEVVQDDRLGPTEKRAILSGWASDACAVESRPGFRWLHGTPGPILVDHVLAALRTLDDMFGLHNPQHDVLMRRKSGQTRHGHLVTQIAKRAPTLAGLSR